MIKADEDLLDKLHKMVAKDLIQRIASGEATPQELAQAIKFLKDNEITADITASKPLQELQGTIQGLEDMPFDVGEEDVKQ